jgi:histidine triad (HIT) family protein
MENCVFCKIIKKELPAEIVFEDNETIAFLDIKPVNIGHLLIIPKEHYQFLQDTPDEIATKVFLRVKKLINPLKKALNADFITISIVGMDVPHFHIHLIPRYKKDGLSNFWPTKESLSDERKKAAEKIKKEI